MSFPLTARIVKQLCGPLSYERGETYSRSGKVVFTMYEPDRSVYAARVLGTSAYEVAIRIDRRGDVFAECGCPAFFTSDRYCKHIAATLIQIMEAEQEGSAPLSSGASLLDPDAGMPKVVHFPGLQGSEGGSAISVGEMRLTENVLGLFERKSGRPSASGALFENRTPLDVEFTVGIHPIGYGNAMFGIDIKLGPKRLYIVQKIKEFLHQYERREEYYFSKHFSYDPQQHCFRPEDDAVLGQLVAIYRNERLVMESTGAFSSSHRGRSGDRSLLVPPSHWEALATLLAAVPNAKLQTAEETSADGIRIADETPPLRFSIDQAGQNGYRLDVDGLERIELMQPYGIIVADGKLLKLPAESCDRLAELKRMLDAHRRRRILLPAERIEAFMDKVVPGLAKLGSVHIADAVADRIMHAPLKAKLFLDRVKDRLLAGLEFQYGDIVLNPLEEGTQRRGEDRIVMRNGEHEQRILELMERTPSVRTEGGYVFADEDAEYEFLYRVIPQLEPLLHVYATSAVKERIFIPHAPPRIIANVDERTDWLEIGFDISGIPEADIRGVLKSLDEKRKYYRMPNGALLPLESEQFQSIVGLLNEMGVRDGDWQDATIRLPAVRSLRLLENERQDFVKLGKSLRKLLDNIRNPDNLDFPVPDSLASVLRDYQKYGYEWLKTLAHYRFGGILADDMGLGKTVQSIAYLVSVLPDIRRRGVPAIIVAPASLVYNWRNELSKFATDVRVVIADGAKNERDALIRDAADCDAIITSYPLLRKDIGQYAKRTFHTLILDEAQAFKNDETQTAQAVKRLKAGFRFALTGTPVENSLEELWSIFDAVFPELFPSRKAFGEMPRELIAKRVRPFLLRRVKADVLKELPDKIESIQLSELLPEQKKLYMAYLAKLRQEALKHLDEETFHRNRIKILAGLTRLRQLCCHPALFVEGYSGSSAKFEQLLELVEECRNAGKRMLVFSQFTQMLGLIGRELGYREVPFFYLDGQTPASERVRLCSRFNSGERDMFLISLKAGGTGLNLTGADTVILYDLWWNPAVEEQAADRAHRIGQKNVVQVIRLVAQGTVEQSMHELQRKKKNLIEEVIRPGEEALSSLTEQDIRELLALG